MSFCANCFKAVKHQGRPEGSMSEIGGIKCYIATPHGDYAQNKAVLFLPNVFGLEMSNNQLLADDFARNGFKTIIPDIMNGDPVPLTLLSSDSLPFDWDEWFAAHDAAEAQLAAIGSEQKASSIVAHNPPPFDWGTWFAAHGPAATRPPLEAVVTALKLDGVTRLAATGYCWGGVALCLRPAFAGDIHAAAIAHPSLLVVPDDLEKYRTTATAPLLINSCADDPPFPPAAQAQVDALLSGGRFAPGYKRAFFDGCAHGFAAHGNMSDPLVRAGKEGAFRGTVDWFLKHL
ncbi:hypothetical protein DFH09DRAFT_1376179 [Mycena vulgaris]|nr:hypothetical protein DFH09DRAFT_1376179 [Mycena vulgaris]